MTSHTLAVAAAALALLSATVPAQPAPSLVAYTGGRLFDGTDAARCMKLDAEVGTLEPAKWADFIALDGDPMVDIANVRRIDSVWIAGNRVQR